LILTSSNNIRADAYFHCFILTSIIIASEKRILGEEVVLLIHSLREKEKLSTGLARTALAELN
jgi:hypothetical protein